MWWVKVRTKFHLGMNEKSSKKSNVKPEQRISFAFKFESVERTTVWRAFCVSSQSKTSLEDCMLTIIVFSYVVYFFLSLFCHLFLPLFTRVNTKSTTFHSCVVRESQRPCHGRRVSCIQRNVLGREKDSRLVSLSGHLLTPSFIFLLCEMCSFYWVPRARWAQLLKHALLTGRHFMMLRLVLAPLCLVEISLRTFLIMSDRSSFMSLSTDITWLGLCMCKCFVLYAVTVIVYAQTHSYDCRCAGVGRWLLFRSFSLPRHSPIPADLTVIYASFDHCQRSHLAACSSTLTMRLPLQIAPHLSKFCVSLWK